VGLLAQFFNEEDLTITVEGIDEYSKKRNAKQKE